MALDGIRTSTSKVQLLPGASVPPAATSKVVPESVIPQGFVVGRLLTARPLSAALRLSVKVVFVAASLVLRFASV